MHALQLQSKTLIIFSITMAGISSLITFPLIIEEVSKRVGHDYVNVGTGMIFFFAQLTTASLTYFLGFVMDEETKISTIFTLQIGIFGYFLSFFLSVLADCLSSRPFGGSKDKGEEEEEPFNKV